MKQDKLFIDTGAWIALIQEKDQFHERASSFLKSLDFSVKRVSSSFILGYGIVRGFLMPTSFLG